MGTRIGLLKIPVLSLVLCLVLYRPTCFAFYCISAVLCDRCWFCCSVLTATVIKEHYYYFFIIRLPLVIIKNTRSVRAWLIADVVNCVNYKTSIAQKPRTQRAQLQCTALQWNCKQWPLMHP